MLLQQKRGNLYSDQFMENFLICWGLLLITCPATTDAHVTRNQSSLPIELMQENLNFADPSIHSKPAGSPSLTSEQNNIPFETQQVENSRTLMPTGRTDYTNTTCHRSGPSSSTSDENISNELQPIELESHDTATSSSNGANITYARSRHQPTIPTQTASHLMDIMIEGNRGLCMAAVGPRISVPDLNSDIESLLQRGPNIGDLDPDQPKDTSKNYSEQEKCNKLGNFFSPLTFAGLSGGIITRLREKTNWKKWLLDIVCFFATATFFASVWLKLAAFYPRIMPEVWGSVNMIVGFIVLTGPACVLLYLGMVMVEP